jgi:hypothetical protein
LDPAEAMRVSFKNLVENLGLQGESKTYATLAAPPAVLNPLIWLLIPSRPKFGFGLAVSTAKHYSFISETG